MSDKFGISASSVICGAASGKSDRGLGCEMADGLKSETLAVNSGDRGVLSDGVRVSKKVLGGESTVNSENQLKSVESGNMEANDKMDASRNTVVQTVPQRNDRWESWGVMNMVGRVLDGKLYMDNEVKDVASFRNAEVNLVAEKDARQDVLGEPTSENIIDIKSSHIDKDPVKLDLSRPSEGSGLNVKQDSVPQETVPDLTLKTEKEFNSKAVEEFNDECDLFIPKTRGEHEIAEKEGEYYVSDLVWGKVRSHPWWPGQIFSPLSASDKAAIHLKSESYLIAYFGDKTFAWNEGSKIKPFRMYFSEMEKQSSFERFSHAVQCALDEAARRVEFGLSCQCLPQEVLDVINFQVTENAGISEYSSRVFGGDNLSGAATFSPGNVMQLLESLAESPRSKPDRLQFMIAKAQVMAYNRWRGHYRLPVFELCGGFSEDDTLLNAAGVVGVLPGPVSEAGNGVSSEKIKSTARDGSSRKRKHLSGDVAGSKIKEKSLSDLMSSGSSSSLINDRKSESRSANSAVSSGENCEMINSVASNSTGRRGRKRKSLLSPSAHGVSQKVEMLPAEIPNPDIFLSELILAAKEPMKAHNATVLGSLHRFRNSICRGKNGATDVQIDSAKCTMDQRSDFQTADIVGVDGTKDSYWTDRIIQSHSQDQASFGSKKPEESGAQIEADVPIFSNLNDGKEGNDIVDLGAESVVVNEASDDYRPTTLILNFSNVESIPSTTNLNEIFSRYGPLNESETKILTKGKRAKVVFKKREDAETAFSSTGKYSIFGPALVSYRLHYAVQSWKANRKTNP